jgi:hypothetical protein
MIKRPHPETFQVRVVVHLHSSWIQQWHCPLQAMLFNLFPLVPICSRKGARSTSPRRVRCRHMNNLSFLLRTYVRSSLSFANELIQAHLSNLYPLTGKMSSRRRSRIHATMLQSLAKLASPSCAVAGNFYLALDQGSRPKLTVYG